MDNYYNIPRLSNSAMGALSMSPAHMRLWLSSSFDSDALRMGRLVHQAVLEPQEYKAVVFAGDRRTKAGKAEYAELIESGAEIVSASEAAIIQGIVDAVRADSVAEGIISGAKSIEEPCFWTDEESGAECKGKADIVSPDGFIWDLKTTSKPASEFKYTLNRWDYDRQAAFYMDGFKAPGFGWIVVEKSAPYGVRVYRASGETISRGRDKYKPLAAVYARCVLMDEWPGYSNKTIEEI